MIRFFITISILVFFACATNAQTSRRAIEKYSTEAVKQITLTGHTTVDILDSLSNNAEVSIEMLSRMGDPDNKRQSKACLKLIDEIVSYSKTETGRKYTDIVRSGLKKALDRSYDSDVQLHIMEQLALCAKPADAPHIAMYLEVPELSATAYRILVNMSDADDRLAEAAASQPGIKGSIQNILDIHAGKKTANMTNVQAKIKKPEPVMFWTTNLDREIYNMADETSLDVNDIIICHNPAKATTLLLDLALQKSGKERDAIIAKTIILLNKSDLENEERYTLLLNADKLTNDINLRRSIIVALGKTHTIQALSYLRKYYGNADFADALAVASTEILSFHPEANGGRSVNAMLYEAKKSFIRHYNENGVDSRIDQVLAAIDNWRADGGYNLAHTEETRMEKRGFWIIHDEMGDCNMVFDWQTNGTITLFIHSEPIITLNRESGVKMVGNNKNYKFNSVNDWCTANVIVKGNCITLSVNGQKLFDNVKVPDNVAFDNKGFTKFLADDSGATIRQYCFKKN